MANSAAREHRERELKFDLPASWELPDPAELVRGRVERRTVHLESLYYDTAGLDLLRNRLTLRSRGGDEDTGWQLKVPQGDARTEIQLPADGRRSVPAELRAATQGVRAGAALNPIARLVTRREVHRLIDRSEQALADIVVDSVSATRLGDTARISTWREVEVELIDGDEKLLAKVGRWLRKRGATPSASGCKLARAMDAAPAKPRDVSMISGLAGAYLDAQADVLIAGDIALRRGRDVVHTTRVATRRYRSVLRELDGLFDSARAAALDAELKWYADALGAVRDRHVLLEQLEQALDELPPELVLGPVKARVKQMLIAEEQEAAARLAADMRTKRYYRLLAELRAWREDLPIAADRPASDIGSYMKKAERKVAKRIARAPAGEGHDAAMHRARKAAKRARYVAELAQPELGSSAKKARKRMKSDQQRLGMRQDAVVAADFLRRAGAAASGAGENGFTFGLLYQRQLARAAELG